MVHVKLDSTDVEGAVAKFEDLLVDSESIEKQLRAFHEENGILEEEVMRKTEGSY